jgi:hypothetical protein
MSYTLNIEKQCGCFKKSGIELPKTFETKEDAIKEANELAEEFNETFCRKHNFGVVENGEEITISVAMAN